MFKLFFADYKSEIRKQHDWMVIGWAEWVIFVLIVLSMLPLLNVEYLSNPKIVAVCIISVCILLAFEHFVAGPDTRKMYGRSKRSSRKNGNNKEKLACKNGCATWFLERRVEKAQMLIKEYITSFDIENETAFIDSLIAECDRALGRTKLSKVIADTLKSIIPIVAFVVSRLFAVLYANFFPNISYDQLWKVVFDSIIQSIVETPELQMLLASLAILLLFILFFFMLVLFPILTELVNNKWALIEDLRSALLYLKHRRKSAVFFKSN